MIRSLVVTLPGTPRLDPAQGRLRRNVLAAASKGRRLRRLEWRAKWALCAAWGPVVGSFWAKERRRIPARPPWRLAGHRDQAWADHRPLAAEAMRWRTKTACSARARDPAFRPRPPDVCAAAKAKKKTVYIRAGADDQRGARRRPGGLRGRLPSPPAPTRSAATLVQAFCRPARPWILALTGRDARPRIGSKRWIWPGPTPRPGRLWARKPEWDARPSRAAP